MHQSCSKNAVFWLNRVENRIFRSTASSDILIYGKFLKFQASPKFFLPDRWCLPAIGTSSAWCKPPDFPQVMYSHVIFTNKYLDLLKIRPLHYLASFQPSLAFLLLCSAKKAQSLLKKMLIKELITVDSQKFRHPNYSAPLRELIVICS